MGFHCNNINLCDSPRGFHDSIVVNSTEHLSLLQHSIPDSIVSCCPSSIPNTTMVFSYDIKQAVTSPLNIMKKKPSHRAEESPPVKDKYKSAYPQQHSRRTETLLSLDDDNSDAPSEGETEFLNTLVKKGENTCAQSQDFYHLDSDQMKKITNKLAQRIVEVDDENGLSTTFSIDSHSCETEVITNLTSKQEDLLAATFQGKSDNWSITMNSLAYGEDVVSNEEGIEVIATAQCDEGVELIPAAVGVQQSKADASPLSNESPLPEPKKYGQYDPFGVKTDYSSGFIHEAPKLKRVRNFSFSNMDNLDKKIRAQASGVFNESSDESSTSIDYLVKWCGGTECVDGAIEVFDD